MTPIEVYADIVCPFTHVGLCRLREARAARRSDRIVLVRAWPLELVNGAPVTPDVVTREINGLRERVAPDLFRAFEPSTFPSTSLPAFGLVAAAYAVDRTAGEAVSFAVRDALFEQGLDVSDTEVLDEIGSTFGIGPPGRAATEAAVHADWDRGKAAGVKGSPHFFADDREWFCPSLDIHHEGDRYDIRLDVDEMHEFYRAVLG